MILETVLALLLSALATTHNTHPRFCVFRDKSEETSMDLHLEWFPNNNIRLKQKDIDQDFNYFYTPCRDGTHCGSGADQTGQIEQSWTNNVCYIISQFDDTILPIYNSSIETWSFYYDNGWDYDCPINGMLRSIFIHWHCNMSTNAIITLVHEIESPSCLYEMYIDSKWACLGQIPPKINNNDQFWNHPMFFILSIICASFIGFICIVIFIWCLYKRFQRRKEIKDLIKDILQEDIDYGATDGATDIDLNDNISDLSKLQQQQQEQQQNNNLNRYYPNLNVTNEEGIGGTTRPKLLTG